MAIGSFVNGFVNGMNIRDTRDNNKRVRGMEDTRFEREGEKHGWNKESHEWSMQRARIAAAKADARGNGKKGKTPSRGDDVRSIMDGYDGGGYSAAPAAGGGMPRSGDFNPGGAELSYGAAQPIEMSAAPAAGGGPETQLAAVGPIPLQGAGPAVIQSQMAQAQRAPLEFDFIPGQGIIPTRGFA